MNLDPTNRVEWKTFRLSEPQNITLQNPGNGDDTEVTVYLMITLVVV